MDHFFGPSWNDTISYYRSIGSSNVPFLVFSDSRHRATIFSFRGFSQDAELTLQIQLFAQHYVVPLIVDSAPFYGELNSYFIGEWTKMANFAGNLFFSPVDRVGHFVDSVTKVYNLYKDEKVVLFVGAEIGGVFAKLVGILNERPGIGFLSFPAADDQIFYQFDFDEQATTFVTNIFNIGGKFGLQENDAGSNFAMPVEFEHALSIDNIYQSFCTLADMCGRTGQFKEYCIAAIGQADFDGIQKYIKKPTEYFRYAFVTEYLMFVLKRHILTIGMLCHNVNTNNNRY
jgi:hypothetical protein